MSADTQADVALRIAKRLVAEEHHGRCESRAGGECDCYKTTRGKYVVAQALVDAHARLAAQEAALRNACADMAGTHVEAEALYHAYLRSLDSGDGNG